MDAEYMIEIRDARREDAGLIAWVVESALDIDGEVSKSIKEVCADVGTLYSWQHARIVSVDGVDAGCLVSYRGEEYMRERNETWMRCWPGMLDVRELDGVEVETFPGEFYLDSMALKPEFRGLGLGRMLLLDGIRRAKGCGARCASLIVSVEKPRLQKYYEEVGFRGCGHIDFFGHGYNRMWCLTDADDDCETLHTSGSTGTPKEIRVRHSRMVHSARMTCDFLGLKPGMTALLCMKTDYIAGRMMEVRAEVRNLNLIRREPSSRPLKDVSEHIDFAAMVPLQVYNSLRNEPDRERLMDIGQLIIGGGAIDEALEAELRRMPNAVWSTYGMTETLSHIALRRVSGRDATEWYTPMPGVELGQDERGCLVIDAPELNPEVLKTNDIVEFEGNQGIRESGNQGACRFRILGRVDNTICSGGIKIQAEEVEKVLDGHYGTGRIVVTSRRDEKYGECVVYLTTMELSMQELRESVPNRYWLPKRIVRVESLPMTPTGKVDRARAKVLAASE